MSSADPSLSLPHQSHTVPPAHSVPYSPSSLPPFRRALSAFPRSPLSPPLARRGPAVSSRRTFRARSPSSCYLARSSPRFRLRSPLSRCSPLANRPQLTLIYVIFSGRPHVTALQCTLNQTCPMRVRSTRGGGKGSERKGTNEDKRGRRAESPNGHPRSPSGDIRNVNRTNQSGTSRPRN